MFSGENDSEKIQNAINYIVDNKINGTVVLRGEYNLTEKLIIDITYCSLDGNAVLNSSITNGETILIAGGTKLYSNLPHQSKSYFKGILLIGQRTTGSIGILYKSSNSAGLTLENVEIANFDIGERYEENSYLVKHIGGGTGRCNIGTQMPDGFKNYGENISYTSYFIANCGICVQNINPNGNFHFVNCSLDYSTVLVDCQKGGVYLFNCHLETNNDNQNIKDAIFKTGNTQDAYICIIGGFLMYWKKPNNIKSCFHTLYNKNTFSIYVNGTKFFNVCNFTEALCTGTGKIKIENIKEPTEGFTSLSGVISRNNNLLNPNFYNNFLELDITSHVGNKSNNITTDNVTVSNYENGLKIVKTTHASNGTIDIYIPIHEKICTYSLKVTDISDSNDATVYLNSYYAKIKFDSNGYIKEKMVQQVGGTRNIKPLSSSSTIYTNQQTGEVSPSWATHFILSFNANAYKGSFKIHDLIINAV